MPYPEDKIWYKVDLVTYQAQRETPTIILPKHEAHTQIRTEEAFHSKSLSGLPITMRNRKLKL